MKKETNEIALIKKSIPNTLLSDIQSLKIIDTKTLSFATEKLSQVNKYLDSVVAWKENKTKPLNALLKTVRAETKPLEEMLTSAVDFIRKQMSEYATEIKRQKQAIADRVKSGTGNLKIETALGKIEAISVPEVTETENGSVKFRPLSTLKVTALDKIPREYFDLNESRLLTALKQGVVVEGAEVVIIQNVVNNRN